MLCGPAASGKSYLAAELLKTYPDAAFFSPDKRLLETSNGEYNWTERRVYHAWAYEQQRFVKWALDGLFDRYLSRIWESEKGARQNVGGKDRVAIWDATFVLPSTRSPLLHFSKGFELRVEAVAVRCDAEECLWRNAQRPEKRRVPEDKIREMIERFSKYGPTLDEGFDLITEHTTPRLRPVVEPKPVQCSFTNYTRIRCENVSVEPLCEKHRSLRCVVCGKEAHFECSSKQAPYGSLDICKTHLCGGGACGMTHSRSHSYSND
jgi:hypothetical protein